MSDRETRIAIIGGGLAGLSAALALGERSRVIQGNRLAVELFEAKRQLGGRAGSFIDPQSHESIDHCQHVAMGCCLNYFDFIRRVGASHHLRRLDSLHFIGPEGQCCEFTSSRMLPAPLHLACGLWALKYLSIRERISIALTLRRLQRAAAKQPKQREYASQSAGDWLRREGQTERQIERFWSVVLTSALSDSVDRVSLSAARKVFVDGFMRSRHGHRVYVPTVPLRTVYDDHVAQRLKSLGVRIRMRSPIQQVDGNIERAAKLVLNDGTSEAVDAVVLAVPWQVAPSILSAQLAKAFPALESCASLEPAAITAVHLWFDRPITDRDHAIFVGRVSQWLFARPDRATIATADSATADKAPANAGVYYQIVISASHAMSAALTDANSSQSETLVEKVVAELKQVFPAANEARVLRSRVITGRDAVYSPTPGSDSLRPTQSTPISNLFLAGDWTATGWPATMEGAVRSGYLAAEALLQSLGRTERIAIDS